MKKEAALFAFIFVGITWIIEYFQLPYADALWLGAGILAALVAYWIRPNAKEGYLKFTGPLLFIVLGGYFVGVKAPKLLLGWLNYRVSGLLCTALYVGCCWLIIKQMKKLRSA